MKYILRSAALLLALVPFLSSCSDSPTEGNARGLRVVVQGLPDGVAAVVTVSGPNAFQRTLTGSEELTGLTNGAYLISASPVTADGATYGAQQPSQNVSVSSDGFATVTVQYVNAASGLAITATGEPDGSVPVLDVIGPGGFAEQVEGDWLLPGLAPGTYIVSARGIVHGDSTYQAKPPVREVVVGGDGAAEVDFAYVAVAKRELNLRIETAYLVQATQTREGAVPMIGGRDAYVRVFGVAGQENSATPPVRVRLYHGTDEVASLLLPSRSGSVPTGVDQGGAATSWNLRVPGELIQPGLGMLVDIDPGNAVAEATEQDNVFPGSGQPQSIVVHAVPPMRLTMVPIHQSVNDRTGNLTVANLDNYLSLAWKLHPIGELEVELREPYSTRAAAFDRGGNVWTTVVSELEAVRKAEAGDPTYYYGVVNPSYNGGGVVGIANGIPSRTSLGWDRFPDAPETLAHELGHNFGRRHAPCGGAGGSDPTYPYSLGLIGVYGMDVAKGDIKAPNSFTDIMGYCETSWWVSDYTFLNVLQYRLDNDGAPSPSTSSSLLIWGRIDDGEIVLEPAFRVDARGSVPRGGGSHRVEGLDANGVVLFSYTFFPAEVSDGPTGARTFALTIPAGIAAADRLVTLRVAGEGKVATATAGGPAGVPDRGPIDPFERSVVRRVNDRTVELGWDDSQHEMVMVRDPASGRILSFARGGSARLTSAADVLELSFSDGVRSSTRRVQVRR